VASFLGAASADDSEALWRLALLTGMRRGEILGLRWPDVDLEHGSLSVRRTMSRGASSRLESGEPKTAAARRRIALPSSLTDSLRTHRVRQLEHRLAVGPAFEDQELVFPKSIGGPLHPNSLANRFRQLIVRTGVPPIRFHDLRQTCATLLLAQGVHPKVVQEQLGHADIAMTMNLYSHVTPDTQRDAAAQLDAMISAAAARLA
jgi:integrase